MKSGDAARSAGSRLPGPTRRAGAGEDITAKVPRAKKPAKARPITVVATPVLMTPKEKAAEDLRKQQDRARESLTSMGCVKLTTLDLNPTAEALDWALREFGDVWSAANAARRAALKSDAVVLLDQLGVPESKARINGVIKDAGRMRHRVEDDSHWRCDERGVYYRAEADDGGEEQWEWVCSRLDVRALTRDVNGEHWGRLLHVYDPDGSCHDWAMPMGMFAGDGASYREELLRLGLLIAPGKGARDRLQLYILTARPSAKVRCATTVGWHDGGVYVLPDQVVGEGDGERYVLQTPDAISKRASLRGTLEDWQEQVARLCIGNNRLIFGLSIAFAGPLLRLVSQSESASFHIFGTSSTGKTTMARVAGSVWGGGDGKLGYATSWKTTTNGLEALAAKHSDGLLVLDEISLLTPRDLSDATYMISGGQGKQRMQRNTAARPRIEWRTMVLSTGEVGLADHAREGGLRVRAGQEVRFVDVPADAGAGLGLFEELHGFPTGREFANHLINASVNQYGTAVRAYLARLVGDRAALTIWVEDVARRWIEDHAGGGDGQVRRVAQHFSLIAAAGELAIHLGILPWERGTASHAARRCFTAWRDRRGNDDQPAEICTGITAVRQFILIHGSSRFEAMGGGEKHISVVNRAGWKQRAGDVTEYLIPADTWKTEVLRGHDSDAIAKALKVAGHLRTTKDRNSVVVRIEGEGALRVYCVRSTLLEDEESGEHPAREGDSCS